jgi:transposase-like protein
MMKPLKQSPPKTRRQFNETFKREAVQNWIASGKSAAVVAEELGLSPGLLYEWKRGRAPADAGGRASAGARPGSPTDLQAQLDAARRENRHLREQCTILKKTLGILSEPSPSATNGFRR